jgi:hypothetical protein
MLQIIFSLIITVHGAQPNCTVLGGQILNLLKTTQKEEPEIFKLMTKKVKDTCPEFTKCSEEALRLIYSEMQLLKSPKTAAEANAVFKTLHESIESPEIGETIKQSIKANTGKRSEVIIIELKDGSKKVFRPLTDENMLANRFTNAYKTMEDMLGTSVTPKVDMVTINGKKGYLSEFVNGAEATNDRLLFSEKGASRVKSIATNQGSVKLDTVNLQQNSLVHFLGRNTDLTGENLKIVRAANGTATVKAIDLGESFGLTNKVSDGLGKELPRFISITERQGVEKILSSEGRSSFRYNLSEAEYKSLADRAKIILERCHQPAVWDNTPVLTCK